MSDIVQHLRNSFNEWESGDELDPDVLLDAANTIEQMRKSRDLWKKSALAYQEHLVRHGCDWTTTLASQPFYEAMKTDGAGELELLRLQVAHLEQRLARGK